MPSKMPSHPNIVIIGRGKVGQSLQQLCRLAGLPARLLGRSQQEQQHAVANADINILCVIDSQIEALCSALSAYFKSGSIVAHCSGALDSESLVSARRQQCHLASIHPLNTFPNLEAALSLFSSLDHNTSLFIEGDTPALERLAPITAKLGFQSFALTSDSKARYHAACVFACNYLSTLIELSQSTAEQAGLDRNAFWQAVQPLIQSTLSNISKHGPAGSLSGPIARGDTLTIEKHLAALHQTKDSYKHLGQATLQLAAQQGELSQEQLSTLETLLS